MAQCKECNFNDGYYKTAARKATKHTKETGHKVMVEMGVSYEVSRFI